MKLYVCYEANYRDCATENGAVNGLRLFESFNYAFGWLKRSVKYALEQGFVVEACSNLSKPSVEAELNQKERFCVELYKGGQENYDYEYDLVIEIVEVE